MLTCDGGSAVLIARHKPHDVVDAGGTRCRLSDPVPRETVNRWTDGDDDDGDGARSEQRIEGVAAKRLPWGCDREITEREGCYEDSPVEGMVCRGERENYWPGEEAPKERGSSGEG